MKILEIDCLATLPGKKVEAGETFCFECHPGVACFNRCCRNLNLFLYPYDVLRLKQCLNMDSDRFLDRYVDIVLRKGLYFPEVLLSMADNAERTCPFVSQYGCTVYPHRPDTCRTFPMEHGLMMDPSGRPTRQLHFFRPPEFCLGRHEAKQWTLETWAEDQEAKLYNQMTSQWAQIVQLFHNDPWGPDGPHGVKGKMAFMAIYNLDRFRAFVFQSSFLKRYQVKQADLKKIRSDDEHLLLFGFEWIQLFVWGMPSRRIRPR
jgi:Fe-S-cluster containining protein